MDLQNILSPCYALALAAAVTLLAGGLSYLFPFYRRQLAVEDHTRLTPLDGLRGILCFAVLCHHAVITYGYLGTGAWQMPPSNFYLLIGQTPVALFFCVTAFLFWSRIEERGGDLPPGPFLRARAFRIVPLYLLSCLLALAVVAPRLRWFSGDTLGGLAALGSMGLQRWGRLGGVNLLNVNAGVTWTLQFEWGFYFLLPALALIVRGAGGPRRLWFLALGMWAMFQPNPIFFFLPGVLAVYVLQRPALVKILRGGPVALAVVAAVAAFPFLTGASFGYVSLALVTVIFVPIACGNALLGVLNWRALRLMGLVSYSVYLLHGIVLYAAQPFLARLKFSLEAGAAGYWAGVAGCAGMVLLLSLATYRWVEWPFIQLERRLRRGTPRTGDLAVRAAGRAGAAAG